MWLIGLASVAASAFIFSNVKWFHARSFSTKLSKGCAALCWLLGAWINATAWGIESGITLTIALFCFGMCIGVFFKLKPQQTPSQSREETV